MSTEEVQVKKSRSLALDALRGFAIITMILSSRIPYGVLPGWMYHVQVPPPLHKFNPAIPGISWVDLVFPFFLFSMGAAFPFAINSRKKQGVTGFKLILDILKRSLLLMIFAIAIMHTRPHTIDPMLGTNSLLLALLLFICMFLVYLRYPDSIKPKFRILLQILGFTGLSIFLFYVVYPNGSGFSLLRYDIIILVLSNVLIAGSIIYVITRGNIIPLLFILIALIGIRFSFGVEHSWVQVIGKAYPSWMLFQLTFLKYLFIIIPGIITGNMLFEKSIEKSIEATISGREKITYAFVAFVLFFMVVFSLFTLYARLTFVLFTVTVLLLPITYRLIAEMKTTYAEYINKLLTPGIAFFILGILFESFEGGIKKDPSTVSYYFITSGLAVFSLVLFMILNEVFMIKKGITLLAENGQNPMLAYAAGTNLLTPVVLLTHLSQSLDTLTIGSPWLGVCKGIFVTLLLAYAVRWFTIKKIFWRT